jgi:hypothetical protein
VELWRGDQVVSVSFIVGESPEEFTAAEDSKMAARGRKKKACLLN